jgi:PadR family transcriptional regulator PadR
MKIETTKKQMRRGILEMCVLGIIAEKEAYPSDIIKKLKKAELIVVEGTLYPLLNRLRTADFLEYNWKESSSGPPRKYYTLTKNGQEFLVELRKAWNHLVHVVELTTKKSDNNE